MSRGNFETCLDDLVWLGKRYRTDEGIPHRASKQARGIFTVQSPEEKIPVPEEFRYIPFLERERVLRCCYFNQRN